MKDSLQKLPDWLPVWGVFAIISVLFAFFGFLLARKLWGKNSKRLRHALEDSAYLASQWATLGISQSQLVEKLGRKITEDLQHFSIKQTELRTEIEQRNLEIQRLESEIEELRNSDAVLSEREIETMQMQAEEIEKRENRIRTLEARLQHLDNQQDQQTSEHQNQVKVLLERIEVLETEGAGHPDQEILENNRKLTELLKTRCEELESLRDEFYIKERDLLKLKEQNAVLKKGVDDLVASWEAKKGENVELEDLKSKLADTSRELNRVRRDHDRKAAEMKILKGDRDSSSSDEVSTLRDELKSIKEELKNSGAQVDVLLEAIAERDSRVEELEARINDGGKQAQVQALTQTIVELQTSLSRVETELQAKNDEIAKVRGGDGKNRVLTEAKTTPRHQNLDTDIVRGKSVIYFNENSAHIRHESEQLIQKIAEDVIESGARLTITGYSDQEGNADFNETLSLRRATAVRDRFAKIGVDPSSVSVKGRGADGSAEGDEARRVEIVVLPVAEVVN